MLLSLHVLICQSIGQTLQLIFKVVVGGPHLEQYQKQVLEEHCFNYYCISPTNISVDALLLSPTPTPLTILLHLDLTFNCQPQDLFGWSLLSVQQAENVTKIISPRKSLQQMTEGFGGYIPQLPCSSTRKTLLVSRRIDSDCP